MQRIPQDLPTSDEEDNVGARFLEPEAPLATDTPFLRAIDAVRLVPLVSLLK